MGGSNAQKHVVEEPKNAPGMFLNRPFLEANNAIAIVKQVNATLHWTLPRLVRTANKRKEMIMS